MTVAGLPGGSYNWRVKGPTYLAAAGTVALAGDPETQVEMGAQRPGDCNNDNTVGLTDFNILKATFGRLSTDPGYDGRADYDGNDTIGLTDFTLLKANFGQLGADPIRPER